MSWIAVGLGAVAVGAGVGSAILGAGKKPKVPDFPKLDLDTLQKLAIAGNISALPGAQGLASAVNVGNLAEVRKSREAALPGAIEQIQENIRNQLGGVADVADTRAAIANAQAANFSLGAGGASQFSKFAVVGKLGRTVAQQRQAGLLNFGAFANLMDTPRFDPSSMFLTAGQRVEEAQLFREGQFNVAMAKAAIKAQPSRTQKALAASLGGISNLASMGFGAVLGGGGGGGSGGDYFQPGGGPQGQGIGWWSRVGRTGFQNNWYLGNQPGPG